MEKRLLAIGLAGFLLAGCGHAKKDVTPSRDGGATSGTYQKLVVFARFSDPASRSDAERAFVKRLSDKGVEGIASSTILSSADTLPNGEIDRAVRQSGSDAVLLVTMTDQKGDLPSASLSSSTRTQANARSDAIVYMPKNQHAGSYYLSLPVAYYSVELIDVTSGRPAWTYNGEAGANTYAKFQELIRSVASRSVDAMRKAHVLNKAQKAEPATRPRRVSPS
jgi:hypothetical protein